MAEITEGVLVIDEGTKMDGTQEVTCCWALVVYYMNY